jgi:hypothetical protein
MRSLLAIVLLFAPFAAAAPTNDNDDSCDIALLPAATLLLPYFETDVNDHTVTTLLSITNVTNLDRIAHVTLWTDRAYPVIGFDVFLTGYDVQTIDLFDVIARGAVTPDAGTGTAIPIVGRTTTRRTPTSDPNPDLDLSACGRLPGFLDDPIVRRMQLAFTEGVVDECHEAGGVHSHAVGYATIDVVGNCTAAGPTDPEYWTRDIRYDNVLIGDYLFIEVPGNFGRQSSAQPNFAQGSQMVHVRAVPEGGTPASRRAAGLVFDAGFERTFYGRYQPPDAPRLDGRQPLPSQFAARWIEGAASDFHTSFKVWREAASPAVSSCADFARAELLDAADVVVFDENENAAGVSSAVTLPATSITSLADDRYPRLANGAEAGWMYLNLDAGLHGRTATQNWIVSSMRAQGRFSTDVDASALGNGCSAAAPATRFAEIAPAPNDNRSPRIGVAATDNDDSCDIALLPAATLLLPYFEVDLNDVQGERTLFTFTNTSPRERIARVTLWTDYAFPVISFNVALTGYDVQAVSLYDVLHDGRIDARACGGVPQQLSSEYIVRMQSAFTLGMVAGPADAEGCAEVGGEHQNAVGYATIDLVSNCAGHNATDTAYWMQDIAFENVLIGDYQQINGAQGSAQGSPMVHIRAVPEMGTLPDRRVHPTRYDAGFRQTFYGRYQSSVAPRLDARQPLPSTFAARWIEGGFQHLRTSFKIWREGAARRTSACGELDDNVTRVNEIVRFDEYENPVAGFPVCRPACIPSDITLPTTSRTSVAESTLYPQLPNGNASGWMFLNLDNDQHNVRGSQNWVVVSMRVEGRFAVDMDAAAMGNGCSPPAGASEVTTGTAIIGPAPDVNP